MATTTPNFGWDIPQSTDLVKDGATAIAALGNDIDTSMVDLKGGTTGQVLSKASNTDMDFTWTSPNPGDITGVTAGTGISGGGTSGDVTITNSMATAIDAKGDLIAGTGADTFSRLAVGSNGYTLVADSSTSTGLAYSPTFFAGKNAVINGDFGIWQRGTSFSQAAAFTADRWTVGYYNALPTSVTISQQAFTAGTAPVSGYEGTYFGRCAITTVGTTTTYEAFTQKIENVRTFAGQTVTLSFWAKADTNRSTTVVVGQNFGSGGSSTVYPLDGQSYNLTSSWQRFSFTFTMTSVSGKTIGANNFVQIFFRAPCASGATFDLWGVQLEAGSTATQFQIATGTIQGELAAAMRYYQRKSAATNFYRYAIGTNISATQAGYIIPFGVQMRTMPSFAASGSFDNVEGTTSKGIVAPTLSSDGNSSDSCFLNTAITSATTGYSIQLRSYSNTTSYLEFSAEL